MLIIIFYAFHCIRFSAARLSKFYRYLHNNEFILINEAQFFDNLKEVVLDMLKNNKKVLSIPLIFVRSYIAEI